VKIWWLASYPKSGNTWVRFLLLHYMHGEVKGSTGLVREFPDLHRGEVPAAAAEHPELGVKVHSLFGPALPYLNASAGCIYIMRHPTDVLLSCLHYMRMTGGVPPEVPDEVYARRFIHEGGDPWMISVGFGRWEDNVRTWTTQKQMPVLALKYEELKKDAATGLRRMLEFMGRPIDEERLAKAVELSSFDRMRALEVQEKASGASSTVFAGGKDQMRKGMFFMNKGQSGRNLKSIAPDLDPLLAQRFGAAMREFGYQPTA
jgi:hypothetical protein